MLRYFVSGIYISFISNTTRTIFLVTSTSSMAWISLNSLVSWQSPFSLLTFRSPLVVLQAAKMKQKIRSEEIEIEVVERRKLIDVEEPEILRKDKELISTVRAPAAAESVKVETLVQGRRVRKVLQAQAEAEKIKVSRRWCLYAQPFASTYGHPDIYFCRSVCLSVCLSANLSVCLSLKTHGSMIWLGSFRPVAALLSCLSSCLSICLFVYIALK